MTEAEREALLQCPRGLALAAFAQPQTIQLLLGLGEWEALAFQEDAVVKFHRLQWEAQKVAS